VQGGRSTPAQPPQGPTAETKPAAPDLITRYNLQEKLASSPAEPQEPESTKPGSKGWSANKDERQSLLQKRRDQMILEARRKMEAKIAAEKEKAGTAGS
jgi:coupling of ubiquitin conjugation to ER degradation protein 1